MSEFYLFLVIVLFSLAIADLIVGVSNDAVNFLNSAVGSRVAPKYVIMIIASLGIFIGATFSSGIMEVARKGIFNPQFFVFSEVMVIFIAVMITDIILLDFFNTLSLPTSTTVSIVFELLGAAVVVSLIKLNANGESLSEIGNYINTSSAFTIISGIFLSVIIAFVVGLFVQTVSRLLFSFQYKQRMKYVGSIWSGFALTSIIYFMLIKGIKGASFVSDEQIKWFGENSIMIMSISFVIVTIVLQFLISFFKINIFKIIVLFGTFALAMAFAGNDLVNFIGVPIAGYESFLSWKASGISSNEFLMTSLSDAVRTPTYLLLFAGLVMVTTLWTSRKARSVTDTEVNLARQSEGLERFSPNILSRSIVRGARSIGKYAFAIIPIRYIRQAEKNFHNSEGNVSSSTAPAFDLVRASVNLTVASILIAFATSLKLPLSTTYVSFMVAMGTSLADRAWGRDSAVYRVSGVLSVIGGWFLTAFIAFVVSGIFALMIYYFNWAAVIILLFAAALIIVLGIKYHRRKESEKQALIAFEYDSEKLTPTKAINQQRSHIAETFAIVRKTFKDVINGIITEERKSLKKSRKDISKLKNQNKQLKSHLFKIIKRIDEDNHEISKIYLKVYNLERDLISAMNTLAETGLDHFENDHKPLLKDQKDRINQIRSDMLSYLDLISSTIQNGIPDSYDKLLSKKTQLDETIEKHLELQVKGIKNNSYGSKNSILYFNILMGTREVTTITFNFIVLLRKILDESSS